MGGAVPPSARDARLPSSLAATASSLRQHYAWRRRPGGIAVAGAASARPERGLRTMGHPTCRTWLDTAIRNKRGGVRSLSRTGSTLRRSRCWRGAGLDAIVVMVLRVPVGGGVVWWAWRRFDRRHHQPPQLIDGRSGRKRKLRIAAADSRASAANFAENTLQM
jgi:hypothetical protein